MEPYYKYNHESSHTPYMYSAVQLYDLSTPLRYSCVYDTPHAQPVPAWPRPPTTHTVFLTVLPRRCATVRHGASASPHRGGTRSSPRSSPQRSSVRRDSTMATHLVKHCDARSVASADAPSATRVVPILGKSSRNDFRGRAVGHESSPRFW